MSGSVSAVTACAIRGCWNTHTPETTPNMTSTIDHDITAALEVSREYRLLYVAGKICGFECESRGWILTLYVGTYETGEYVEGRAQRGNVVQQLTSEQAHVGRTKLPPEMPKPA